MVHQLMGATARQDYTAGRRLVTAWLKKHPDHVYAADVRRQLTRLDQLRRLKKLLESGAERLSQVLIEDESGPSGKVVAVRDGTVRLQKKVESGRVLATVALTSLAPQHMGTLLTALDPSTAAEHEIVWWLGQGQLTRAAELLARAEAGERDVGGLWAWLEDWQRAVLNRQAYQALSDVASLLEAAKVEEAGARFEALAAEFGHSDVFALQTAEVEALRQALLAAPPGLPREKGRAP